MNLCELFGSLAAIFFALILFFSLASNPPIHSAWVRGGGLTAPSFEELGDAISSHLWRNLYPALIGLIVIAVVLAVALSALLRRGE